MHINELDNYSLADAIVFHDSLNPAIWNKQQMRPEVRQQLLKIARHFVESMGLSSIRVADITVSGSNAAFTYTPHSDIDLHLICDIPQMQDEIYRAYFDLKKYEYNNKHNIKIRGFDVELYVQLVSEPEAASMGVFSVKNNKWISIPKKVKATIDDATVNAKVDDLSMRAELALKSDNAEAIALVKDHIYAMRRAGLEEGGEFSPENLAFKILRTNGILDALREKGAAAVDNELSLEQQNAVDAQAIIAEWNGVMEDISSGELSQVENFVNQLWSKLQVKVNLLPKGNLHHFLDRVNDKRNGKDITPDEIINLFVKEYKKYGLDISKIDDDTELMFRDLSTQINIPVVVSPGTGWDKRMKAKTIMRKRNFHPYPGDVVMAVESKLNEDTIMEVPMSPGSLQKFADKEAENLGLLLGFEFELYFPGANVGGSDTEPDMDQDTSADSISEIIDFFNNRSADNPCGNREAQRLEEKLREKFWDWASENYDNYISNNSRDFDDLLRDKIDDEVSFHDCMMQAEDELGEDADSTALTKRANEIRDEKIDEIMDEGMDNSDYERAYDNAREEFQDDYFSNLGSDDEREFLEYNGWDYMSSVDNEFGIGWPYWTSSSSGDLDISTIAGEFMDYIGADVTYSDSYHGEKSEANLHKWRVEPDSSLSDPDSDEDGGIEFVSPPLPLKDALQAFKDFVGFARSNGCYTNETTGLHMNMSVTGQNEDTLDYVKLALFLGDKYVLEKFGRQFNSFCKSAVDKIKLKSDPDTVAMVMAKMRKEIGIEASKMIHNGNTEKYISINNHGNYVEFRSPGGDWLRGEQNDLINTALRFAKALSIATDPNAHREEYAKKLYKLISEAAPDSEPDIVNMFAHYVSGDLPKEMLVASLRRRDRLRKLNKGQAQIWEVWLKRAPKERAEVYARDRDSAIARARIQNEFLDRFQDDNDFAVRPTGVTKDNKQGAMQWWEVWKTDTPMLKMEVVANSEINAIQTAQKQKPEWNRFLSYLFTAKATGKEYEGNVSASAGEAQQVGRLSVNPPPQSHIDAARQAASEHRNWNVTNRASGNSTTVVARSAEDAINQVSDFTSLPASRFSAELRT